MPLNVALQMDAMASINPLTDSTLLIGREAQKRGHAVWHYTPDKLTLCDGRITARAQRATFHDDPKHYCDSADEEVIDLRTMDVVWLRQDPPFNVQYITTTYILEQLRPDTLVVNDPAGVRDLPEKLFPTLFRQFMPPTLITADVAEIERFRAEHKDIVVKPLYGYAGRSVLHIKSGDDNFHSLMEVLFSHSKIPLMVQPFLPEVKTGERRVIMIDGEIRATMGRIPAQGEIRVNFRVGGSPARAEITAGQKKACDALALTLKERGQIFAGLDFIGDKLIEVNLTSPTGLAAINKLYGLTLEAELWDAVERKL